MPRIPQIIAESDIRTGPVAPEASPIAFSNGAQGMGALGEGIASTGEVSQIYRKQQQDDAHRWVTTASSQFVEESSKFLEDEQNKNAEDYAQRSLDYLKSQKSEYLKKAPNRFARDAFDQLASNFTNSQYRQALRRTNENKIQRATIDIGDGINRSLSAFRTMAASDPEIAAGAVEPIRQQLLKQADETFGAKSVTAGKLREIIDRDFILGIGERNTPYARQLLEQTTNIDEATRRVIANHLDEFENAANSELRVTIKQGLEDRIAQAQAQGKPVESPNDAIFDIFGKGKDSVKNWFTQQATAWNDFLTITKDLKDKNAPYQAQKLQEISQSVTTEAQKVALSKAASVLDDSWKAQRTDSVGWQMRNNLDVYQAFQKAKGLPADQQPQAMATAYEVSLQFQGQAPAGTTPTEAARYLNLQSHERHLMSKDEATTRSRAIKNGDPSAQVEALRSMQKEFLRKEHWAMAYNDLVTLPPEGERIPQELQLAFLIEDPGIQKQFVSAISNREGIKGLTEESKNEFRDKLQGNKLWKAFERSFTGDLFGGTIPLEGYRQGFISYAYALSLTGQKPKEAIENSINRVLGNHMGFTEVNGQTVAIPKYRYTDAFGPQLPPRTDEEIADLGRRMAISLRDLDIRQVRRVDDVGRPILPLTPPVGAGSVEANQYVRDAITSKGFFSSEADGESMTLYLMGDNGVAFQLRDNDGRPFELYLDALPRYGVRVSTLLNPKGLNVNEAPSKSYNLREYSGIWKTDRINWPVTGDFWFRQVQQPPFRLPPHALKPQPID